MQFDTDKQLRGYQDDPYRQRSISRQSQEPQNQEDFFKQFENYKSNIENPGINPQMNFQKGPTNDFNAFPSGKKEQLFANPNINANNLANPTTETERDRRLRLRSEERKRRNTGQAASVYEQPQIQESLDKPPEMWDFQHRQADLKMLYEVQNTENPNRGYQEEKPQAYDQPSPDIKAKAASIPNNTNSDESASLKYQKQQQYKAYLDEQVSNTQNKGRALSQQRVETGATVDNYNDAKEQEARKKRQYALELQAQIEQKNKAVVSQEIREDVGLIQNSADLEREKKRRYAQELQAQIQAQAQAKNNQKRNFSDENNYDINLPGNSQQDAERERKKRYAQELQAQIQAKEAQKGYRRSTTQDSSTRNSQEQEFMPQQTPQDIERERKKQYAQELQAQIQAKQNKNTEKKYENYTHDALPPKGNDEAALKKKLYAQELQAQIMAKQALQGDKNKRSSSMERPSSELYYQQRQDIYQPRQENLYQARQESPYQQRQDNLYQPRLENVYQPRQENMYQPRDEQFSSFDQRSFNPDYEKMNPEQFQSFQPSYDKPPERFQSLSTQPDYPPYQPPQINPPQSYNPQQEVPFTRENSITKQNAPPQDREKINRYRQELEIQIEEAKKRKEEEKRKQKEDDERHEKKFFMEVPNENKPLIMKKVDPNRPSEDHPQAQRYQELMEKAKIQKENSEEFPEVKQNYKFQEDSKADFNRPSKIAEPSTIDSSFPPTKPNYKFQQKQEEFSQGAANFPPANPQLNFPQASPQLNFPPNPQFNFPDTQLQSPGNFQKNPPYDPRNAYLKEMQDIRMEREKARDQMLEMREMMLKEREKQLESMLLMLKIQPPMYGFPPQQTRPVSYGSNMQMEANEFPQYNLPNPQFPPGSRQYNNNPSPLMTETSNPYEIPQPNTNFNQKPYDLASPPANYSQPNTNFNQKPYDLGSPPANYSQPYDFSAPKINKDVKQGLFGQPQNANLVDLQGEQRVKQPGYADLLTASPQSEELFEKSLMSSQKWVDPHLMKWGEVKIADSTQVPIENPSPERKKWGSPKKNLDVEVKNCETFKADSQDTPKFQLKTIPEENPSLFQANEVDEHIEEEINEIYPTQEDEENENLVENPSSDSHKEIILSQPKYEESAELQIAPDSLRGSEDSINMQSASIGSNYSQEVKTTPKVEIAFNFKEPAEETSTDIINNFLQGQKQRQAVGKSEGPKRSLAISRLDEARMYAKQHKAKDVFEELDTKLMEELSKPKFTPKYEDSLEKPAKEVGFTGKFTKVALNELRKQKYQNSIDNILQDSRPSSKSSTRQAVDDFLSKFEKESSPHKSSSRQSRRYENQDPII